MSEKNPLWVMRPTPVRTADVATVMGREALMRKEIDLSLPRHQYDSSAAYIWTIQDKAARQCDINILDPSVQLCDNQSCAAETNGLPIYRDDNHLTEYGNQLLIPIFESISFQT